MTATPSSDPRIGGGAGASSGIDGPPTLAIDGPVATLNLRRPRHHNRIDADDTAIISAHLARVEASETARVLIVTGEGERTFCAGYTLAQIGDRLDRGFEEMLDRLEQLSLPTIALLNGSAYGGGTDLAICCDFRIGVRGSRMFMPAARFGLHYYPGGLRRFSAQLGPAATKKIFLTGLALDDEEMLRVGFLQELVERERLSQTLAAYVDGLIAADATVCASMKRHIDRWGWSSVDDDEGRHEYERSLRSCATARRLAALR